MRTLTLIDPQPMETLPEEPMQRVFVAAVSEFGNGVRNLPCHIIRTYERCGDLECSAWSYTATFAEEGGEG